MSYKILIVDDELDILNMLKQYFEMNQYLVYTADCGQKALEQVVNQPDIILLDVNMPDLNGLDVCSRIREHVNCPIIFLTAKVEEADKIKGFSVGGDDYVTKPFSLQELGARVSAHLRRQNRVVQSTKIKVDEDLVIDYTEQQLYYQGEPINLAKKEYLIIELLSQNPKQTFDKERIYDKVWGYESEGDSSVIAEHIRRIRTKLSKYSDKTYIETVWGMGYKWIN
ncbi:MAG TPA: DNA-binding response regulator [Firmicutes bacterium]|nr:DNA-binding response regulator [Bacillota bacterium]